jgi:hypothetical protein
MKLRNAAWPFSPITPDSVENVTIVDGVLMEATVPKLVERLTSVSHLNEQR